VDESEFELELLIQTDAYGVRVKAREKYISILSPINGLPVYCPRQDTSGMGNYFRSKKQSDTEN
jgi:hypothetical protein